MASGVTQNPRGGSSSLDPAVLRTIRLSASQLAEHRDEFAQQLHSHIAALLPNAAGLAPLGPAFCERMVDALLWAALTGDPPQLVTDTLRQLGARNWLEGVPNERYVSIAHALVRAVRALTGYEWSASLGSAWITYFQWARLHLAFGASQAAAQQAAAQQAAAQQGAFRQAAPQHEPEPEPAAPAQEPPGTAPPAAAGEVGLESVAGLFGDEDDEGEDGGYGQIMLSMTFNPRREPPRHRG